MRRWIGALLVGLLIGATWTRGMEPQSGKGVFAGLKVGQTVTFKYVGTDDEFGVLDYPLPAAEEVAEDRLGG